MGFLRRAFPEAFSRRSYAIELGLCTTHLIYLVAERKPCAMDRTMRLVRLDSLAAV